MRHLDPYLPKADIAAIVRSIAASVDGFYRNVIVEENPLLVICVLRGAFVFTSDLIRAMHTPLTIDFIRTSSYHGTRALDNVKIYDPIPEVAGRHVLLCEDILDTGHTLFCLQNQFSSAGALSVHCCALFDKPANRRFNIVSPFPSKRIDDKFVVGYGLDCDEKYRNLPEAYVLRGV